MANSQPEPALTPEQREFLLDKFAKMRDWLVSDIRPRINEDAKPWFDKVIDVVDRERPSGEAAQ